MSKGTRVLLLGSQKPNLKTKSLSINPPLETQRPDACFKNNNILSTQRCTRDQKLPHLHHFYLLLIYFMLYRNLGDFGQGDLNLLAIHLEKGKTRSYSQSGLKSFSHCVFSSLLFARMELNSLRCDPDDRALKMLRPRQREVTPVWGSWRLRTAIMSPSSCKFIIPCLNKWTILHV